MRRRRLGRCLLRADLAIEDGDVVQARTAIEEAREIGGNTPELTELEDRLQGIVPPPAASPSRLRGLRPLIAAGGGLLLVSLVFVGVWGNESWRGMGIGSAGLAPAMDEPSSTPAPAPQSPSRADDQPLRLRVLSETVSARAVRPRVLFEEPEGRSSPPQQSAPIASSRSAVPDPAPTPAPAAAPPSELRAAASPPPAPPPPRPEPAATPPRLTEPIAVQRIPDPMPPVLPPRPAPADAGSPDAVSAVRSSPSAEPVRAVDQSAGIRSTLQRYAAAYSRLDAAAASAVWPAVNRRELERAFDGLVSQNVSLGQCDVRVDGAAAHATCAGSATWQPKVGGGARTEPRQWRFELRKDGEAWQIERAIARGGL